MSQKSEVTQVLRFVAAALVLYAHHTYYYWERIDKSIRSSGLGPQGVALFFFISGLVMVMSTRNSESGWLGAKLFLLKRIVRVVPMYWVATSAKIAIAIMLPHLVMSNGFEPWRALGSYLFVPMLNDEGYMRPILGVGWTLIHEMYFYALFALSILVCRKHAWLIACVAMLIMLVGGGYWASSLGSHNAWTILLSNPINLYFVFGTLAGAALSAPDGSWHWRAALGVLLSLLTLQGVFYSDLLWPFLSHPLALGLGAALLFVYKVRLPSAFRFLSSLGDSSYALYLFHTFYSTATLLALHWLFPALNPWAKIWVSVLIAVPVAHAIYVFFEKPVTRWISGRVLGPGGGRSRAGGQPAVSG